MKLGEVAEILSGIIVQRIQAPPLEKAAAFYPLLTLREYHIDGICREKLDTLRCTRELSDDELTRQGDVVLRSSPPFGALYMGPEAAGIIVPHFFSILVPHKINGKFLASWLNSTSTLELLEKHGEGTSLKTIKRRQLLELHIPALTESEQIAYAEIDRLARKEQRLLKKYAELRFRRSQAALSTMSESR